MSTTLQPEMMRLFGREAVHYARAENLLLSKYNDDTEGAREDITPEQAMRVIDEDPRRIYIDIPNRRYHVKAILTREFGGLLFASDDAEKAKEFANEHAWDFHYGTAVIDTQENTADLGDRIVSLTDAFV